MKKRILSLLLAAVCAMSVASCGKPASNGEEIPTLKYYVPNDPQKDVALIEEKLNELTVAKIGAKVELEFIDWSAWKEKTNLMLASNEEFDVMSGYTMKLADLVKNGSALGLSALLETEAKELKNLLDDYYWKAASYDGEIYVVPNQQIVAANDAIAVRKDLAEKYNFDVNSVETIMDLEPFWKQIRDNEPELYPFRMKGARFFITDAVEKYGITDAYTGFASTVGNVSISWEDYKLRTLYEDIGMKAGAKLAYECAKEGYFRKDLSSVSDDSADYAVGRYASTTDWYKPGIEAEIKNATGYDYIVKLISDISVKEATPLSTTTFINANTKNPEKSIKFVELLNTDKEVYNLLCFGIEGTHYTWVDDEHIQCNPDGGYFPNASWAFGNQFNAHPQVGQEADVWEQTKKMNDEATKSPFMGANFTTEDVTLELAQVNKIKDLYVSARMDKGIADPDTYWEDYTQELKKAGMDTIRDNVQKQVDEFLAKKN